MINRMKAFAAVSCLGVASLIPQFAVADQWNKKTILTVNEPIQVPGKVLQPGKYVMKLLDSPSNRHIVQIFNEREDQLQTTVLAIPNYRLQPTGKTEFGWWEVPAGQPRALRAWFYPGDNFGQEFAYPKTAAVQIAAVNNTTVPMTSAQTESDLATSRVSEVDKAGTEQELDRQTYNAPAEQKTTEVAQNQATPQPADVTSSVQTAQPRHTETMARSTMPANTDTGRNRTLPSTGSEFPLIGLAGFAALGASTLVRAIAKRS
jgi:hypothetical protein